ncbi:MAG TPA: cell division protein SepF, partial [Solirubrobacterales bacterium]|nr:cell division protein SepF [Solirubrobacterales bacterium]
MAVRDTWNRALVYFGLAEDHDYRYEDDYDPYEPDTVSEEVAPAPRRQRATSASNVRRLRREEQPADDIDDIFAD